MLDPAYPSLSVSPKAPGYPAGDADDLSATGYTPRYFIRDLLDGRYGLVQLSFPNALSPPPQQRHPSIPLSTTLSSALGQYGGASLSWQLALLVRMGYLPVKDQYSGVVLYRPTSRLEQLRWFAGCFGPYQARGADVDVRIRGSGGLVCIDRGGLHLSARHRPRRPTSSRRSVKVGGRLAFASRQPLTPLQSRHSTVTTGLHRSVRTLSNRTRPLPGAWSTVGLPSRLPSGLRWAEVPLGAAWVTLDAVLEVPVSKGESTAHVSINLSVVDSPTIFATSKNGSLASFTLLDVTPADIKNL